MKVLSSFPRTIACFFYLIAWGFFCLSLVYPAVLGNYILSHGKAAQGTIAEKFIKRHGQPAVSVRYEYGTGGTLQRSYEITPESYSRVTAQQKAPVHYLSFYPKFFMPDSLPYSSKSLGPLLFAGLLLPSGVLIYAAVMERKEYLKKK